MPPQGIPRHSGGDCRLTREPAIYKFRAGFVNEPGQALHDLFLKFSAADSPSIAKLAQNGNKLPNLSDIILQLFLEHGKVPSHGVEDADAAIHCRVI
ncbi:MAG: hypothetical protein WC551_13025 [Patescibacteria group bacterium]